MLVDADVDTLYDEMLNVLVGCSSECLCGHFVWQDKLIVGFIFIRNIDRYDFIALKNWG